MLVFKAAQVIASGAYVEKPYKMKGDSGEMVEGVSRYCDVTALSSDGTVAVIRCKGRDPDEVKAKVSKLSIGKPAEIPVRDVEERVRGGSVLVLVA